jgi:TctA family transporter
MLISRGDILVFLERPISAVFISLCVILIGGQLYFRLKPGKKAQPGSDVEQPLAAE